MNLTHDFAYANCGVVFFRMEDAQMESRPV